MPDAPHEFKVLDIRRLPSTDLTRMGKWDKIVIYELDPEHRYSVAVPEETFTEDTLRAAVKADMQERAAWLDKTFHL